MPDISKIAIYVPDDEAKMFIAFQKNYELFDILAKSGALEMKFGKITLNMANGKIQTINKEEIVFHR